MNTFDKDLADIIKNKEVKEILLTLGCGLGESFDINKLRYDKIILAADQDDDGGHIVLLLLTLFLQHTPKLIDAGKIFVAHTPLYAVGKGKTRKYFFTQEEFDKYMKTHTPKHIDRFKGLGALSSEETEEVLVNDETRVILPMTTKDMEKTLELYYDLMSRFSKAKAEFANADEDFMEEWY